MASKQNDLMLNIIENPHMNLGDFQSVGLSANNTSLEDESVYLNSKKITENPMFLDASGEFDKVKFHDKYIEATQALQAMSSADNSGFLPTYSKYNIFAPINQVDLEPQFELTKALNPDRITKSMITVGLSGPREMSIAEIAQSQQVYNSETGEWMDTPEDMFSFGKLFSDVVGFFSDNFGSTKVLAQYDEDVDINGKVRGEAGFDENMIEHFKGDYKLNENGTYYYRTLKDNEDIYGKQVLHFSDILTREGSALNSIDFLDSDDIQKSTFGSFVKNASLIGSFFLPYVGPAIAGATIFLQAAGLGATLGKIALGSDSTLMNWIEGTVEATNPIKTRSEYSQQSNWTIENLLGMVGDVVGLLYQQRLLFKYAPAVFKGKWGVSEKNQEALKTKILGDLESQNKKILSGITDVASNQKAVAELKLLNDTQAAAKVEEYMKQYYKLGEELSKAYMTMLTVNEIYGEAKQAGAEDFDAALVTAGYAAMEYALLSTDIGKWILPELRANRIADRAMVNVLSKDTIAAFKKLAQEATTSEAAKRNYLQKVVDWGKQWAKGEFAAGLKKRASIEGGKGMLKAGASSLFAGALAEAVEETSEELLADFSKVLYNGLEQLRGKDSRMTPFENMFDRYTMSFLGGFLGGGVASASMDFSEARTAVNMDFKQAMQRLVYKARNNDLDGIYKLIDGKDAIGDKNLSASKIIEANDGSLIWKLGSETDNQDVAIKNNLRRIVDLVKNTLDAHGGNLSNLSLLDAQTMRDIRYRALQQTTTAGRFIQHYNELLTELVENTIKLKSSNTPLAKADAGERDQKDEKSPELEAGRRKLEERNKELDKEIEDFTSGKLAPLFMASALIESTPFIAKEFMASTFRYYAESKAKTKFENISENELKNLLVQYQNYLKTSKKDDIKVATDGYISMLQLIRENLEEAKKYAADSAENAELRDYLETFTLTLSLFSQNLLLMDDDTWVENLLNFAQLSEIGEKIATGFLLLRNTLKEANISTELERNKAIQDANDAFEAGMIDEETRNNTIKVAYENYERETLHNLEQFNKGRENLVFEGLIQGALKLADKVLESGYINGAIRSNILSQLETSKNIINKLKSLLEEEIYSAPDQLRDYYVDVLNNLYPLLTELEEKITKIKELPYTPILLNLDSFALSLNGGNVSGILDILGKQINGNRSNLSGFTIDRDVYKLVNEALRVINLYIAALEGARTDNVDPFKVGVDAKGNPIDKTNVWGINKVLNEVHAKSPKIEDDPWVDLPEIEGVVADMMIKDARSIKKLLETYKRLYNINEGQKLNVQTRVAVKTTYLLYSKIKHIITNADDDDIDKSKIERVLNSLSFLEERTSGDIKDWNINLSLAEQVQLEKERIILEDAIYDFFNTDNEVLLTDSEKLENFISKNFKILDSRTELLTEGAEDIDGTSMLGYIASKAAFKSSIFYKNFSALLDGKIAPIISLELGVQLQLANILRGKVISIFSLATRNILINKFKESSFKERVNMLTTFGEDEVTAAVFATEEGSKYYPTHDSVILFSNITFIDGVPGAGKSTAVDALVIKYLLKYHSDSDVLKNAWVSHGGDSENSTKFSLKFKNDIGLGEGTEGVFNRDQLMKKISDDAKSRGSDGTFEILPEDYSAEGGIITPTWKLNDIAEEEIPSLIIIDEAQQFTLFDLLTIDKFAKKYGIPVIMSGDLQLSKATGTIEVSVESILQMNRELKENDWPDEKKLSESNPFHMTIGLARNLVLHSPKLGTSMRSANNQKDANSGAIRLAIERKGGQIGLHYYEDEETIAGDLLFYPSDTDNILKAIDKILPHLKDGEMINFAHRSNSKLVELLKGNGKYSGKINYIEGTALGQEGDYWIFEPEVSSDNKVDADIFLSDLYTGSTRSKVAGLIICPETLNGGQISIANVRDLETHKIQYSEAAVEKYAKRRIDMLKEVLNDVPSENIEYLKRESVTTEEAPTTTVVPPPAELEPDLSRIEEEVRRIEELMEEEGEIDEDDSDKTIDELATKFVENGIVKLPCVTPNGEHITSEIVNEHNRGRAFILIDINGVKIPFIMHYLTTSYYYNKWIPLINLDHINDDSYNEEDIFYPKDEDGYYESPLLKAIGEKLNEKYPILLLDDGTVTSSIGTIYSGYSETIPILDESLKTPREEITAKQSAEREARILKELHEAAGIPFEVELVKYNDDEEEEEEVEEEVVEEQPIEDDELPDEDTQVLVSNLDVVRSEPAKELLEEATIADNPGSDGINREPTGLSLLEFTYFLFSNATFELGTTAVDKANNVCLDSPRNYDLAGSPLPKAHLRIDSINGLKNCPKAVNNTQLHKGTDALGRDIWALKESENFLAGLRKVLLNTKSKSDIERQISFLTGINGVYVRYAIKTSEFHDPPLDRPEYNRLEKDPNEDLPYARARVDLTEKHKKVNNRNLVAIIGNDTNGDAIEIPLLTLNNPITMILIHDSLGNYKFPKIHQEYDTAFNAAGGHANWLRALIAGLRAVLDYIHNTPGVNPKDYLGLSNLIKLYLRTARNIAFIPQLNWTPALDLQSFGPQLHLHRGDDNYDEEQYVQERRWISLDDFKQDPTIKVTKIYLLLDKSELSLKLSLPKHPFVLYTDALYNHEGRQMLTDEDIIEEYEWEREDITRPQNVKIAYVLPPEFSLKEYIESVRRFTEEKKGSPLGNQRTAFKILLVLFAMDPNKMRNIFRQVFGEDAGDKNFNKVITLIHNLGNMSIEEQMKELQKSVTFNLEGGMGLNKMTNLHKHLRNILKQLIYPGGVTITGNVLLRSGGTQNTQILEDISELFARSGVSLFYLSRASKNAQDVVRGIFSPVLVDTNGHINDDNISDKNFYINANLSSSTFLAGTAFNNIIDYIVNQVLNKPGDAWLSWDNIPYTKGYSGWNISRVSSLRSASEQTTFVERVRPSISPSITSKLLAAGLTTNVLPQVVNDNSKELKLTIATEINLSNSGRFAFVLPNGELVISDKVRPETSRNTRIITDGDPFLSRLQYQFKIEWTLSDGTTESYNVVYNPVTKEAKMTNSNPSINYFSYYDDVEPEFVEENIDKFKELLRVISESNSPKFTESVKLIAKDLIDNGDAEEISDFLNNPFGGALKQIIEADFDKSQFNDILKFSQDENNCPIKIKFI